MRLTPRELGAITLWEFAAYQDAWLEINGKKPTGELSDETLADMDIVGFNE